MQPGESLISPGQVVGERRILRGDGRDARRPAASSPPTTSRRGRACSIIDEYLARRFWPNGDALGKRMYFPADINNLLAKPTEEQMMTIVGIIEPMRLRGLVEAAGAARPAPTTAPFRQAPSRTLAWRCAPRRRPRRVTNAVRREIAQIDPELPFYGVRTHGGSAVDVADGSAHADAAGDRLRRGGAVPRRDRHLRRAGVSGVAAPPRDRHSHGARRGVGQHLQPGVARRRTDCRRSARRSAWSARSSCGRRCSRSSTKPARWIRRVVAAVAAMLIAVALDRVRVAGATSREDRSADRAERSVTLISN